MAVVKALERLRALAGDDAAARVERRVTRLPSEDLIRWVESTIVATGRAFGDWQTTANPAVDSLGEARMAAAALQTALDELDRRRAAGVL